MTSHLSSAPFSERLAVVRRLIAQGAPVPAVHLADQIGAASGEARLFHDQLGVLLPIVAPERAWYQRLDTSPSTDTRAYLLAAVLSCLGSVCCHLKRGGPQPAFAQLALRRVACQRCVATIRRPPADSDDLCDVCSRHGVTTFIPFAAHHGPALVVGDACRGCARVLGILVEAAS
jgi:hypothetical protein